MGDGFTPLEEISGHFRPSSHLNPPEAPGSIWVPNHHRGTLPLTADHRRSLSHRGRRSQGAPWQWLAAAGSPLKHQPHSGHRNKKLDRTFTLKKKTSTQSQIPERFWKNIYIYPREKRVKKKTCYSHPGGTLREAIRDSNCYDWELVWETMRSPGAVRRD